MLHKYWKKTCLWSTFQKIAFKMAGCEPEESQRIINLLGGAALHRLTSPGGLDRRLIMPVITHAWAICDNGPQNLDAAVSRLLGDQNFMCGLIAKLS